MEQERISPIEFARLQRACANTYEDLLWQLLRNRKGMKFRRQHPLGIYTLDFYCAEAALNIEIDGTHHFRPASIQRKVKSPRARPPSFSPSSRPSILAASSFPSSSRRN